MLRIFGRVSETKISGYTLRPDTDGFGEKPFSEVRCMPEVPCKGGMGGLNTLFKPVGEKGDPYRRVNENWLWNGRDV